MSSDSIPYNPSIVLIDAGLPKDYDPETYGFPGILEDESLFSEDYAYFLAKFMQDGRNIFHLEPGLIELFNKTKIDDVVLEDVLLPYDSFYLHFGEAAGIEAPNYFGEYSELYNKELNKSSGVFIEGAFVELQRDHFGDYQSIQLLLVPKAYGDSGFSHLINLDCHVKGGVVRKDVKNSVLNAFKDAIHQNPFQNDLMNQKSNNHSVLGKDFDWHQAKKDWRPSAEKLAWEAAATKAITLIVNAILYLTSQDSDVEEDFPDSYPKKLVTKAKSDNIKEAKRAESKLASQGYTKIKFVGRSVKKYFQHEHSSSSVSSHWRRGHWRKQPFGSKEEGKTRPVWIKPTIVNKGAGEEQNIPGHIYEV